MSIPRRPGPSRRVRVQEVRGKDLQSREDRLATEEPLEIRLGWPGCAPDRLTVTMRTPGHDFELTAGFLFGEGIIEGDDHLHTIAYCSDHALSRDQEFNVVTAELQRPPATAPAPRYHGPTAGSSACGVCGKQSVADALAAGSTRTPQESSEPVPAAVISGLPERLRTAQKVFSATGGLHAAALCEVDGSPVAVREDIGRHNAVDKVVGSRVLAGEATCLPILWVSGRIGFELAQKAVAAGVRVIAAVGAPSSLAVDLAAGAGLCTVGFVREDRFVVYTEPSAIGV